ncbi:MAG: carboxypeptidase-like regulatory domain-containing protein [Verrucomicrobiota bacterium]
MNKRTKIIRRFVLFLAILTLVSWLIRHNKSAKNSGVETTESQQSPIASSALPGTSATDAPPNLMLALLQTPILFYGVVLDQHGQPIPGAKVSASAVDNVMRGTPVSTTADATGKFTIRSKGASLRIEVSSIGHGRVERGGTLKPSSQGFDYGADIGRGIHSPDPAYPVVFQLRKPQNPVSLERLNANPSVPRDGSPITVSLSKTSKVTLQISCRTLEVETQPPNAPYDWRCKISVGGGGIQEAKDDQAFEAPADSYASSTIIDMPKTLDVKQWSSRVSKSYWLRFPDNTFAKIGFRMNARGDHFAVIDGSRNPSPNDRNLEPKL